MLSFAYRIKRQPGSNLRLRETRARSMGFYGVISGVMTPYSLLPFVVGRVRKLEVRKGWRNGRMEDDSHFSTTKFAKFKRFLKNLNKILLKFLSFR